MFKCGTGTTAERVLSAQKFEEKDQSPVWTKYVFQQYKVVASLTYLTSTSRFMTALQANAESDPECVMYHWLSILGTDSSWNTVFTAMLQCQTCGAALVCKH